MFHIEFIINSQYNPCSWHRNHILFTYKLLNYRMPEDKVAYEDRAIISYKTENEHPEHYTVVDSRSISLAMFLVQHDHIFDNAAVLRGLQLYVDLTLRRRFASTDSLRHLNELAFYQQTTQIAQFKAILGCALETIPPFQLHSFFAFILGWSTYAEMTRNYPLSGYFEQTILWPSGRTSREFYPPWLAPSSPVTYISGRLGLDSNKSIQRLDFDGYQSAVQIGAALNGYLRFYTHSRYFTAFS